MPMARLSASTVMSGDLGHALRARGVELAPNMGAQLGEARIGAHRLDIARPAERKLEHLLDAAGTGAHHGDAIAEQDSLIDRMGDEHHGLALVGPLHELEQFALQDLAPLPPRPRQSPLPQPTPGTST